MTARVVGLAFVMLASRGCSRSDRHPAHVGSADRQVHDQRESTNSGDPLAARPSARSAAASKREVHTMATLKVTSSAFEPGKSIPSVCAYKGAGQNQSCPLGWSGAPEGTKSFVVIVDDPDAPSPRHPRAKPWVHWVLYDIPGATTALSQGQSIGMAGRNDFGETKWGGPLPPAGSGRHRYFFKVYALDKMLNLSVGATKDQVLAAMNGHVVAQGELFGTYER